jgi:hypothetical protein
MEYLKSQNAIGAIPRTLASRWNTRLAFVRPDLLLCFFYFVELQR